MSIPFQDSETAKNLLRAFAGESQARNRYDFAANLCQKQELQAMAFIFQATAKQEQAHAKVFWDHLQALNGQNLPIYGAVDRQITPLRAPTGFWSCCAPPSTTSTRSMVPYTPPSPPSRPRRASRRPPPPSGRLPPLNNSTASVSACWQTSWKVGLCSSRR